MLYCQNISIFIWKVQETIHWVENISRWDLNYLSCAIKQKYSFKFMFSCDWCAGKTAQKNFSSCIVRVQGYMCKSNTILIWDKGSNLITWLDLICTTGGWPDTKSSNWVEGGRKYGTNISLWLWDIVDTKNWRRVLKSWAWRAGKRAEGRRLEFVCRDP